ncbi:tail fiber domain-containing protein [Bradyrhizobium sp. AZCC 1610]|uniref:tail fiber domain-containing protein n=1 Tax=Bradyrhizobium sp. AZCC 1610 TaxID=3117020 RepID=UPI002FF3A402
MNAAMQVLDQRLRSLEPFSPSWEAAVNELRAVGLSRLNDAILPAYQRIQLLSDVGFLQAASTTELTLTVGQSLTFVIDDETERSLFVPGPFLAITRESTTADYAIAQRVSYDNDTGELMVVIKSVTGNPGPFSDWWIGALAGTALAGMSYFAAIDAARAATIAAKDTAVTKAAQTAADRVQTGADAASALSSKIAAAASAAAAQTWDPSNYYPKADIDTNFALKTYVDTKVAGIVNSAPAALDTLNEFAAALGNDANFSTTISASLGNRLRIDVNNQNLNATQKANALTNLGIGFGNPTVTVGTAAQNGSASTFMRSDAAPAINQAMSPSWTGSHTWTNNIGGYLQNRATWSNVNIYATDSQAAVVTFHRGAYAMHMGLDPDNYFRWGGWSDGATARMYISPGGLIYSPGGYGAATTPVSGQVRAAGDIVYGLSDVRLKKEIETIENALDKVAQLRGVTWAQNELALEAGAQVQKRRKAGLLAQDVEKVLPEAVNLAPFDTDEDGESSKSGQNYLTIDWDQTIGLLVEAIKELKAKVEKLEGEGR